VDILRIRLLQQLTGYSGATAADLHRLPYFPNCSNYTGPNQAGSTATTHTSFAVNDPSNHRHYNQSREDDGDENLNPGGIPFVPVLFSAQASLEQTVTRAGRQLRSHRKLLASLFPAIFLQQQVNKVVVRFHKSGIKGDGRAEPLLRCWQIVFFEIAPTQITRHLRFFSMRDIIAVTRRLNRLCIVTFGVFVIL
jgi:hypothetical protein